MMMMMMMNNDTNKTVQLVKCTNQPTNPTWTGLILSESEETKRLRLRSDLY